MINGHVVMDLKDQVMRCMVCGDEIPIPLGRLSWVTAVAGAFEKAHPKELHAGGLTMMSEPKALMMALAPMAMAGANTELKAKVTRWLIEGEVGSSSKAMAGCVVGMDSGNSTPSDPDDLRRCLLFLEAVPEARECMDKVAGLSPRWAALVKNWAALETCFMDECGLRCEKGHSAPKTWAMMKEVKP